MHPLKILTDIGVRHHQTVYTKLLAQGSNSRSTPSSASSAQLIPTPPKLEFHQKISATLVRPDATSLFTSSPSLTSNKAAGIDWWCLNICTAEYGFSLCCLADWILGSSLRGQLVVPSLQYLQHRHSHQYQFVTKRCQWHSLRVRKWRGITFPLIASFLLTLLIVFESISLPELEWSNGWRVSTLFLLLFLCLRSHNQRYTAKDFILTRSTRRYFLICPNLWICSKTGKKTVNNEDLHQTD